MPRRTPAILLLLAAATASALCPHEVLVLANDTSIDSVLVARTFLRLRGIPESNLVRLSLPENLSPGNGAISPADFTKHIWEPACAAVRGRCVKKNLFFLSSYLIFPAEEANIH